MDSDTTPPQAPPPGAERHEDDGSRTGAPTLPRRIPTSQNREVVVRAADPADLPALVALYDGLDLHDRYLRFFSAQRPPDEFIARLLRPGPREARVVAELVGSDGSRLVAEAGYDLLPNGNGELAIVVAPAWRGWLGPYLLDLVVGLAAANGVDSLEAQVLSTDAVTLALLRSRGCVLLGHDGWSESRLMIGTGSDGPTWDDIDDRPRVLVETPSGRWPLEDAALAAGMRVITCSGPRAERPCPLLSGGTCALAACADVVVMPKPPADERWEAILERHPSSQHDVPVIAAPTGAGGPEPAIEDIRVPAFVHFSLRTAGRTREHDPQE